MANKDLKLEPHWIDEDVWWYEDSRGIDVHVDFRAPDGALNKHLSALILWKDVRAALKRKDS